MEEKFDLLSEHPLQILELFAYADTFILKVINKQFPFYIIKNQTPTHHSFLRFYTAPQSNDKVNTTESVVYTIEIPESIQKKVYTSTYKE